MKKKQLNTKELILRTSENLFSNQGYDSTSVDEIAKKAKIPKSLIYYYFKSKKQILETLFDNFEKELIELKEKTFENIFSEETKEIKSKFKENLIKYTFPFLEKWKNIIKIAFTEEIKSFSKGPLFKYFDINLSLARELYNKHNLNPDFSQDKITSTFFISFLPLIGYTIFIDEWCSHYRVEKEKVKEIITEELLKNFTNIIDNLISF
ncbi:MAG: TetR/AcrR family transcriptional regulator [Brevinematales bacterium]|nr:TetR/AcrR family transcriptional regulator [Brevinematales bacterium]